MARANALHPWGVGLGASALLASLLGCGTRTVSPHVDVDGSAFAPISADRPISDVPAVRDVQVDPRGDDLSIELRFDAAPAHDRLPFDPNPVSGSSWFFVLTLDPDQTRTTGRETGSDFELFPLSSSEIGVRVSGGGPTIGSIAITTKPHRVEFRVPRSMLGDDDGMLDYTLDLFQVEVVGGDRDVEHVSTFLGTNHPVATTASQVPLVMNLSTDVRNGMFLMQAKIESRDGLAPIFYSASTVGGWQFQLFVNTDGQPTGYWNGYDYVVRGGEQRGDQVVVRTTENVDTNPGGWGPETGTAQLDLSTRSFGLALPLAAIGNDDGNFDFVLETYATMSCPSCPGGTRASLLDDYFGSTGQSSRRAVLLNPGVPFDERLLADRRVMTRTRTSDTDY